MMESPAVWGVQLQWGGVQESWWGTNRGPVEDQWLQLRSETAVGTGWVAVWPSTQRSVSPTISITMHGECWLFWVVKRHSKSSFRKKKCNLFVVPILFLSLCFVINLNTLYTCTIILKMFFCVRKIQNSVFFFSKCSQKLPPFC